MEWFQVYAVVGLSLCLLRLSFGTGKVVAELKAINHKLGGQLAWIEKIDSRVDDHEKRLTRVECKLEERQ